MRVLVLGGTAWVGHAVARAALEAGHEVTCLARGTSGDAPAGATLVRADRDRPDAYDAVAAESWDSVVDVATHPGQVRSAVAALAPAVARWAYVSSGNVYRSAALIGEDETATLLEPLAGERMRSLEDYGAAKVACEQAVVKALGDRALIARAGLIGGPGDRSGRSGYWPWRFAHPADPAGRVLVPAGDVETALIDVRDLARWLVDFVTGSGSAAPSGVYDAVANRCTLAEYLAVARTVAGHAGELVAMSDAWLLEHEVGQWMGPRSLPMWLCDPEALGFAGRSGAKVLAAGLSPRPLAETLADVLAWEESRDEPGPHGAGLSDDEERELLEAAVAS